MADFGKGHHLLLVDGSGYIFRAFYRAERSLAPKYRYRTDGTPVGAVHFFCSMLLKDVLESKKNPTHIAVIFDYSSTTFRTDLYPEYKANRPPPPEDLIPQFASTRAATRAFNLPCIELEGYEADDIIATFARQAREAGGEVTIISSDKDLMQLVGDGVVIYDTMKDKDIGREQVHDRFGVYPELVTDVQALAGDSSDNIPGAPGIGIKTAPLLINEFGDLETLLACADQISQNKRRETLIEFADQIRLSKKLVTLDTQVPLDYNLTDLELREADPDTLFEFLQAQEFRSLVQRVAKVLKVDPPALQPREQTKTGEETVIQQDNVKMPFDYDGYECITTEEQLEKWLDTIIELGSVAIDTETTSLDEMVAELVGVSLSCVIGKACYIPLGHTQDSTLLSDTSAPEPKQLDKTFVLEKLKPVLEDASILKIGQNIKYDIKIFRKYKIYVAPVDDTMLLSYVLHSGLHNLNMTVLSVKYLDHTPIPISDLIKKGRNKRLFSQAPIGEATRYAAEDADITLRLWMHFKPQLSRNQVTTAYETLDRPLIPVLVDMERTGIRVDSIRLQQLSKRFTDELFVLEKQIHKEAGQIFNIASPMQLGDILFNKLELPSGSARTARGFKTGATILEDLASSGYKMPRLVLDWRHLAKLKSTYTDALQGYVNSNTGRVHTSYRIAGANTGRLASTDPNLQNIPIRTDEGRKIREAFIPDEGYKLVSLDYSQIELRVLAHTADIEELRAAFREGQDIHAMTASQIFDIPIENMDPMVRRKAKAINFGIIYGISAFGLARDLRIARQEAQFFIDRYFARFPGIQTYMSTTIESAKRDKYVKTLFGRRINTPNIDQSGAKGQFARRAAINAPIQGTAADIIRRAMIRIPDVIAKLPAKMLLSVHDELVFEVREDAIGDFLAVAVPVMEKSDRPALEIKPDLVVDAGYGDNWAVAH